MATGGAGGAGGSPGGAGPPPAAAVATATKTLGYARAHVEAGEDVHVATFGKEISGKGRVLVMLCRLCQPGDDVLLHAYVAGADGTRGAAAFRGERVGDHLVLFDTPGFHKVNARYSKDARRFYWGQQENGTTLEYCNNPVTSGLWGLGKNLCPWGSHHYWGSRRNMVDTFMLVLRVTREKTYYDIVNEVQAYEALRKRIYDECGNSNSVLIVTGRDALTGHGFEEQIRLHLSETLVAGNWALINAAAPEDEDYVELARIFDVAVKYGVQALRHRKSYRRWASRWTGPKEDRFQA